MIEISSKIAESVLTKVFNETSEELFKDLIEGEPGKEVLKDDADNILINRYNEKIVKRHKSEITEKSNQVYNKATKENAEKVINLLKDNFSYDSDETDIEKAFQIVKDKINSKLKNPLTDDQVKAHKLFVDLEKKALQDIDKLNKDWEGKINAIQGEFQKKENFARVIDTINSYFIDLKPVLPTNEIVRKNRISDFISKFKIYDFIFENGNDTPLIMQADKRVENATGHAVSLKELVKMVTESNFELQAQDLKESTSNTTTTTTTQTYHFKDENDFNTQFFTEIDPAKKVAMGAAWKAQNKK